MKFKKYFKRLMKSEGGYVNHKSDPGGETKYGVTKRVARQYGYNGSMRNIPISTAQEIAKKLYWDKVRADEFSSAIVWQLLDASFNHGNKRAVIFLQKALGIVADGIIGSKTIAAAKQANQAELLLKFNAERLKFYAKLKTFSVFGRGWTRRVADNLEYAADDITE